MASKKLPVPEGGNGPKNVRPNGEAAPPHPCFIAAIGASAGGQEALEQLFTLMPSDCGISFVVVMHIPATGPSFLTEMLGRFTSMEVVTVEDGMPPLPNRIQVIPAGRDVTLEGGQLRLRAPDGTHHPVDRLFLTLAAAPEFRKMAVVLSGSGSDGAAGARAIRDAGGTVLIQDPGSALYSGMPDSIIAAGAADLVLQPAEIPIRIAEIARGTCSLTPPTCQPVSLDEELGTICALIKQRTGHDYSSYKAATLLRRIERRMAVHEIGGIAKYVALLRQSPQEAHALGQDILIGVTSFFRDPEAFAVLRRKVIPQLFTGREPEDSVRIWHACCATGEEVYSMAMLVREYLEEQRTDARVQLFATDIDEASIAQARAGLYPADIEAEVGEERLRNYFVSGGGRHFQVVKQLREMVIFAHHSLVKDPPFSRLDLIVCRNFLIYLNPDMQKRLISLFHQVLKPGGYLFLGASETVGRNSDLFIPVDKNWRVYQRKETGRRSDVPFPFATTVPRLTSTIRPTRSTGSSVPSPGTYAEKYLVERYAPPCVVVNEQYEAVYFSTKTSRYLAPPAGEPTVDVIRMAREELRPSLRAAIHKAFSDQKQVVFRGVNVSFEEGEAAVTIQAEPIDTPPHAGRLVSVAFEAVPAVEVPDILAAAEEASSGSELSRDTLVRQLEENLRVTREQLQATVEQLETSSEVFMSANEELITINEEYQATNEELQATNEELETSKEELQALNEELATVNVELQGTVEEARQANADLENLFASSEIATIFLAGGLVVKRYSPAMARIFKLVPADIGRPFRLLQGTVEWPDLPGDVAAVLDTLVPLEREMAALTDGRHYLTRVLPYHASTGAIDGVVVTLIDITAHKRAEERIQSVALFPEENPFPVLRLGGDGTLLYANRASAALLEQWQCSTGDAAPEPVRRELAAALESGAGRELEVRCGERDLSFMLVPIAERGYVNFYGRDVTSRKRAVDALKTAKEEWERTFDSVPDLIAIMDDRHRVVRANRAMAERLGTTPDNCVDCLCFSCVHDADRPPEFCPHARTLADGRSHTVEAHVERLGGYFLITTVPLLDARGTITGSVHVARDITERKRAEEALRESELFYRQTLESIPGMVFTTRPDGFCDYQSQQWVDFTGVPISEHLGDGWNRLLHPDDRPRAFAAWRAAVEGRAPYDLEYRVRRRDGVFEWFKVAGRPIRDEDGQIVRWFGVALNIEELKKSEEALRKVHAELEERVEERTIELGSAMNTLHEETAIRLRATEELREKERMLMHQSRQAAMGEMIGNIAHQWRQPLNALGLAIQQLELAYECGSLDKVQFDENIAKAMEIIFHMSQTIDDFRNFYRPDKEKAWFKIGQLLERTVSLVEANFRADRISIEIDDGEDAEIQGYPNEYAQALLNILMNARDAFLERNAGERRIVIRHRREEGRSVVTVTDNAGGIPEEVMGKIFDPYFTTKEQGRGTGVGLFMSKTIIEKNMGGRLTAENVEGGAEFRIEV